MFLFIQNATDVACYSLFPRVCSYMSGLFYVEYVGGKLEVIVFPTYYFHVSIYTITGALLLCGVFSTCYFFTERNPMVGVLASLSLLDVDFLSWAFKFIYINKNANIELRTLTQILFVFSEGFLGQDLYVLVLVGLLFVTSYYTFNSLAKSIQIASLSLAVLPLIIYTLDGSEFYIHFEGAFSSFYFITNYSLLIGCVVVFSVTTIYYNLLRPIVGRIIKKTQRQVAGKPNFERGQSITNS